MIETIGRYNAQTDPSEIVLDKERLQYWLDRGAQPSHTVKKLMRAETSPRPSAVEDLLEFLARSLVDNPDKVKIEGFDEDDGTIVLEMRVADDDVGKVIGRGGRTVSSLRTVMRAVASRQDERVLVDVVD